MHEADLALARLRADAEKQAEWRRATAHLTRHTAPKHTRSRAQAPQRGKTSTGRSTTPTRRDTRPYVIPPSAVAEWKRMNAQLGQKPPPNISPAGLRTLGQTMRGGIW